MDDSAAQKALEKLKRAPIDCMDLAKAAERTGKKDYRSLGALCGHMLDANSIKPKSTKEIAVQERASVPRVHCFQSDDPARVFRAEGLGQDGAQDE